MKAILVYLILLVNISFGFGATLEWDRNPEPNVIGYRVYVGRVSRIYDLVLDIGNQIITQVPTNPGRTYFAVTAYDSDGFESEYSEEVFYTKVSNPYGLPPNYKLTNVTLRVPSGKFYVERADNTSAWLSLNVVTGPTNMTFSTLGTMGFFRFKPYFVSFASPTKGGATKLMEIKKPMIISKPIIPISSSIPVIGHTVNLDPSKR